MKNLKIIVSFILFAIGSTSSAQTGTSGDPFTSLNQSANLTTPGIYYFNLGGTTFDTYVNENGYVLLILDYGTGIGDIPTTSSMDTITRGVMNATVLASLNDIAEVRINSTSGNTDVTTSNDSIIWRVQNNMALHRGYMDTTINQDWVGLNDSAFTHIPIVMCGPTGNSTLSDKIIHNCGGYDSFTWFPEFNYQREDWMDGEVPGNIKFQLWVKGTACTGPVNTVDVISTCTPIVWIDGNTYTSSNNTATHALTTTQGCDSIVQLDLTIDPANASVTQNGPELTANSAGQAYQWIDCNNGNAPITGANDQIFTAASNGSYAVIVDNGNCADTSSCYTIEGLGFNQSIVNQIRVYPNPVQNALTIQTSLDLEQIIITDLSGRTIYSIDSNINSIIELTDLPSGAYIIKISTQKGVYSTRLIKN